MFYPETLSPLGLALLYLLPRHLVPLLAQFHQVQLTAIHNR